MEVKFKKLAPEATIPTEAKRGDAGIDLIVTRIVKEDTEVIWLETDLAVEIPLGYVGLLFPRSSVSKYNLQLANSVGVIDSSYRGSIQFRFNKTIGSESVCYTTGDKAGQLIILPYPTIKPVESTDLSSTDRGEGGFGSTGK